MDRERFVPPEGRQEKRRITSANLLSCLDHPEQYDVEPSLVHLTAVGNRPTFSLHGRDAEELARRKGQAVTFAGEASARGADRRGVINHAEGDEEAERMTELVERTLPLLQEYAGWFGDDARIERSHEYDDRRNGVDLLLTFDTDDGPFHCAIDLTVGNTTATIARKLSTMRGEVLASRLGTVAYARDGEHVRPMKLERVPKVLVPFDPQNVTEEVLVPAARLLRRQSKDERKATNRALVESTMPYGILDTMAFQLRDQLNLITHEERRKIPRESAQDMRARITAVLSEIERRRDEHAAHRPLRMDRMQRAVREALTPV